MRQSGRPRSVLPSPLEDPEAFAALRDRASAFWGDSRNVRYRALWAAWFGPADAAGELALD
jgi:hypothetical protein